MPQVIPIAIAAFQAAATVATTVGAAMGFSGAIATVVGAASIAQSTMQVWSAISSAVSPKPKVNAATTQLQTKVGAVTPRSIIMGRTAVAGTLLTPTPLQSGRGNALATNFYALSHAGPSGVVESVIWGDDTVTFDGQGQAIGKYANNMWLFQKNGSWSQTSITFTGTPGIGADTPTAWDSTKRAQGCLVVALVVRYAASVLANNMQTPLFVVDANAVALTDPRTGSAATTQAQRRNPAVWAYSWRLGWFQNSKRVIGLGQPASELHAAGYAYAANVADANGWTVSGEASTADDRYAVEVAILQACASVPVERNGLQSVVTSALRSSVGTITSNDLRADPKWKYNTQQSSRPTAIQTRWRSEGNRWQMVEGAEVTDASWLTQDAGREKRITVEYAYAGGGSAHVGHLAALDASNAREPLIFTLQCKQQARYAGFVGDAVTVSLPEIGLSSTKMVILSRVVNADGTVDYDVLVETDAKYSFAAGKTSAAPSFTLNPGFDIYSVPQPDSADWAVTAAQITSGATSLPIVRITGSAANYNFASGLVFKLRINSGGSPWLVSEEAPPAATQHEFRGLTNATSYIAGVAYRGVTGVEGPVRELGPVTTGTLVAGEAGTGIGGKPILNELVVGFANQAIDTEFTYPSRTWTNNFSSSGAWSFSSNTTGGVRYYRRSASNAAAGAQVNLGSDGQMAFPVVAGQRIEASVLISWLNFSSATLFVTWYDANRGYLTDSTVASTTTNGATIGGFVTVPGNARFAGLTVAGNTVTANISSYLEIGRPFLRIASAEQTALSPYVPGPVERNANQGATVGTDFRFPDQSIAPIGRVDNALSPLGENQVVNSDLNQGLNGFEFAGAGGTNLTGTGLNVSGGRNLTMSPGYFGARNVFFTYAGLASGNFTGGSYLEGFRQLGISGPTPSNLRRYATQVTPGERIYYSAKIAVHGMTTGQVNVNFYDRDGAFISSSNVTSTIGDARAGGPSGQLGLPSNFATLGTFFTVPTNAFFVAMSTSGLNVNGAQSSAYVFACDYFIAKVGADQTVAPAYNPGPVDRASDRTGENTAGGFLGQGNQATTNIYRQSTAPSSPNEGDIWEDISTTPVSIRRRIYGAWVFQGEEGADITAQAVPSLEGPASFTFDVDSVGALSPGSQVPRTLQFIRKRGNTDVSTSTTWSIVSPVNVTLGTITNGGVNVTAIAAGNSNFTVRSVRDGVTIDLLVTVVKNTIAAAGVGGSKIARDVTATGIATGTYSAVLSGTINSGPAGLARVEVNYLPLTWSGSSSNFQFRLTRAGVQLAETGIFNGIDGAGDVGDFLTEIQTLAGFYTVAAGSAVWALEAKRTSGSGSINSAAGELIISQTET